MAVIIVRFYSKFKCVVNFSKTSEKSNVLEIRYAVLELLNVDRLRERETWNTFATFLENELLIN